MTISARTPEGEPNRCPLCQATVCVEPSQLFGDAPCPACGHLLWFAKVGGTFLWFDQASALPIRERLVQFVSELTGVAASVIREKAERGDVSFWSDMNEAADSLDLVELVMELEDASNG